MPENFNNNFINYIKEHNLDESMFQEFNNEMTNRLEQQIDEMMQEKFNEFEPAYSDNTPMPGEDFDVYKFNNDKTLKEEAENELIAGAALRKAKTEKDAYNKLPIETKVKDFWIKQSIKNWVNECYNKNGFEPSGRQKRDMKRKLERNYGKKSAYTPNAKQYEEIVDYLNMPSSSEDANKNNPMKNQKSTGQNISSLLSTI